eukprot:1750505-Prymnesium_polylepis.1
MGVQRGGRRAFGNGRPCGALAMLCAVGGGASRWHAARTARARAVCRAARRGCRRRRWRARWRG